MKENKDNITNDELEKLGESDMDGVSGGVSGDEETLGEVKEVECPRCGKIGAKYDGTIINGITIYRCLHCPSDLVILPSGIVADYYKYKKDPDLYE